LGFPLINDNIIKNKNNKNNKNNKKVILFLKCFFTKSFYC
jgi:hypothetical protein